MWIILKTFELSKNPLIYLTYFILIITTLSNQQVKEPADPTNIQIDNEAEGTDSIPSNMEKGSTVNDGTGGTNNVIKGFFENLSSRKNIAPVIGNEVNSMDLKKNDISTADNEIENHNVEEDSIKNTKLSLNPEDVEPKEQTNSKKKKKRKRKKKKKPTSKTVDEQVVDDNDLETGAESNTIAVTSDTMDSTITEISNPEKDPTEDIQGTPQNQNPGTEENPEDYKRKAIRQVFENMKARSNIPKTNENEINNYNPVEKEIDDEEDSFKNKELSLNPQNVEPEEQTNSKKKKKRKRKKKKKPTLKTDDEQVVDDYDLETGAESNTIAGTSNTVESTTTEISDPEKNPIENTEEPLKQIDSKELKLENVEIIKIKGNPTNISEAIRKKRKKVKFQEFARDKNEAHIYCTFLGDVFKMYRKVKNCFVGKFCHAIVLGTPIILKQHRVHLSLKMKKQLNFIQPIEKESLVIVIMEFWKYLPWEHEHDTRNLKQTLVTDIIDMVVKYNIDGIQFSNLHPSKNGNEIDATMMKNLVTFFQLLQTAAKQKQHVLKIGINFNLNDLSYANSFTSDINLNQLVTWYTFKSISMVKCTAEYRLKSTSPLDTFKTIIETLIKNVNNSNKFNMKKLIVGIQLYPNKVNDIHPYTYEELCSIPKKKWRSWCVADTQNLRAKGLFLRGTQIGGVQLYYMHSDDYRAKCGCFSFPLIRALLRGLINSTSPEICNLGMHKTK